MDSNPENGNMNCSHAEGRQPFESTGRNLCGLSTLWTEQIGQKGQNENTGSEVALALIQTSALILPWIQRQINTLAWRLPPYAALLAEFPASAAPAAPFERLSPIINRRGQRRTPFTIVNTID